MFDGFRQRRAMMRAWADHDADTFRSFVSCIESLSGRPIAKMAVLDLGCGLNAPMTVMLHAAGARVTGVDSTLGPRWGLGFKLDRHLAFAKEHGIARAARKLAGEIAFDRLYFQRLAESSKLDLKDEGLDLRQLDVQKFGLSENAFDVIHSNATWEHIPDVSAANLTLARALKPGGLGYIEIHLFPSLSGGHDLPWIVPGKTLMGDRVAWGHLLDPNWKAPVYLNRLRERDYREAFEKTPGLRIREWKVEYTEGEELVTPELLKKLPGYSKEELTKRSIIVVVQKA
jgi:SAM-dependent methyltransferase